MCAGDQGAPWSNYIYNILCTIFWEKNCKNITKCATQEQIQKNKKWQKKVAKNVIKNIHVLCVKKYDDRNPIL